MFFSPQNIKTLDDNTKRLNHRVVLSIYSDEADNLHIEKLMVDFMKRKTRSDKAIFALSNYK